MKFINLKSISISLATLLFVASLAIVGCGKKAPTTEADCNTRGGSWDREKKSCTGHDRFTSGFTELNVYETDGSFSTYEIVDYEQYGHTIDITVDDSEDNE